MSASRAAARFATIAAIPALFAVGFAPPAQAYCEGVIDTACHPSWDPGAQRCTVHVELGVDAFCILRVIN